MALENLGKLLRWIKKIINKKYSETERKMFFLMTSEFLVGVSRYQLLHHYLTGNGTNMGVLNAGRISFLTFVATLITNESFSKFKLRDGINMIAIFYQKTSNRPMIH